MDFNSVVRDFIRPTCVYAGAIAVAGVVFVSIHLYLPIEDNEIVPTF